ncbi:MAG TPA: GAF domain-containing protein, partial [Stellaceae bacterium]|nr:GAF domain-containing protein [Stellaceae bacterium]
EAIKASPGDATPALDATLREVDRLCDADFGIFWRFDGAFFHAAAVRATEEFSGFLRNHPQRPPIASDLGRILCGEPFIHRSDYGAGKHVNAALNRATVELGRCRAGLLLPLRKDKQTLGAIRIFREEARPFSEKQIQLAQDLADRFAALAALSSALENRQIVGMVDALDLMRQPTVVLNNMGFVLFTNAAAEALFDHDIRIISHRLVLRDKGANAAFLMLLDRLRARDDAAVLAVKPIVVRREGRSSLLIRVLPLASAGHQPLFGDLVILAITELAPKPSPDPAIVAQAFGLTRAEARLASLLATGMSPDAAAKQLGVAPGTVRSQLKAVFAKTETHRQSELAALLARFS